MRDSSSSSARWEKAGEVDVDAGLLWLGDPCYVLHKNDSDRAPDLGASWEQFCARLEEREGESEDDNCLPAVQFYHVDQGEEAAAPAGVRSAPGLGVVVSSFGGDGTFPVEVLRDRDGCVLGVRVMFQESEDEEGA